MEIVIDVFKVKDRLDYFSLDGQTDETVALIKKIRSLNSMFVPYAVLTTEEYKILKRFLP